MRFWLTSISAAFLLFPLIAGTALAGPDDSSSLTNEAASPEASSSSNPTNDIAPLYDIQPALPVKPLGMLFDLAQWRGEENFLEQRRKLERAAINVKGDNRDLAYLNLSRFYFSNGLAREADSSLIAIKSPSSKDALAMKAFIALFEGDIKEAENLANDKSIAHTLEATLILAMVRHHQENFAEAVKYFHEALPPISDFPPPWRQEIRFAAIESMLKTNDLDGAKDHLAMLKKDRLGVEQMDRLAYDEALWLFASGEEKKAKNIWTGLLETASGEIKVKAGLTLLAMAEAEGPIDPSEKAKRLEKLLHQGPAGDSDFKIMWELARIYMQLGEAQKAFDLWEKSLAHYPAEGQKEERIQEIKTAFAVYVETQSRNPDASLLALLSFYEEHKNYRPEGREGLNVDLALADALIRSDLIQEADQLLDHLVEQLPAGEERARYGLKAAELRLAMDLPREAKVILEKSDAGTIPDDLKLSRQILGARATFALGDTLKALNILQPFENEPANLARLDIYWQLRQWKDAAVELEHIISRKLEKARIVNPALRVLLFQQAIAYNMGGDRKALADLRRKYGVTFLADEMGKGFAALTAPNQYNNISGKIMSAEQLIEFVEKQKDLAL